MTMSVNMRMAAVFTTVTTRMVTTRARVSPAFSFTATRTTVLVSVPASSSVSVYISACLSLYLSVN